MPKELSLTSKQLNDLVDEFSTPLQLYDEKMIIDNIRQFMSTFQNYFPTFKQYFAVKALPNRHILDIMIAEGLGLDCSSVTELKLATQSKCNDVMFTSNYLSYEDLTEALKYERNIVINCDDVDVIYKLQQIKQNGVPNVNMPELLCFRLNPTIGTTDSGISSNVLSGSNTKFGIDTDQIVEVYRLAQTMGISRFGLHVMTGSCVMDPIYWYDLVNVVYKVINQLYVTLGIQIEFVNLGGGIGIQYMPDLPDVDIGQIALNIRVAFDENIIRYGHIFEPLLCMENGRYITGNYGWLITRCKSIKRKTSGVFYGLDACMSNLMRPGMYGAYHHITVPRLNKYDTEYVLSNVAGSLCENNDWFAKDRLLPKNICTDDIFIIHDTGAHSHSMGFQYNGKLRAPEVLLLSNGNVKLIRRRETFEDYVSTVV
jgi:diaminopimelate decarboxylase